METAKKISTFFCFSSLICLLFTTNQTMSESEHMDTFCTESSAKFTKNSTYHTNLNTLLSTLSNQSSLANYYNLTTGLASDTVHGSFICLGDVNRTTCNSCVKTATIEIAKNCTNHREAITYYYDCMVRYSDKFFLSTLETKPNTSWSPNDDPIPKSFGKFKQRLSDKMGEVIVRSSMMSSSLTPYYLKDTTRFNNLYDLESIVQCDPYLDPGNCTTCLKIAFQDLTDCCSDQRWAMIFTPKCFVSFDTYNSSLPALPPNHSGSFSIKGTSKIFGGMAVTVAALVFTVLGL